MTSARPDSSRREFLKSGVALVVGIALAPESVLGQAAGAPAPLPGSLNTNRMLSSWLRVNPGGTVTVFTGKIELGQGIATALAQIAADELDVDYRRIEMVTGDTSRTPNEGVTAGSLSMEQSGTAVRFACAEARELLLDAAAARLGVTPAEMKVADGTVTASGGKQATYWELTSEAMLRREASAKAKPKQPGDYKYVGQSLARRDIPGKFTGAPAYVQDLRLPGMLHARVVRPPAPRAELVSVDIAAVKRLPGVVGVVRDGNFLAVACEREEQAIKAREALRDSAVWMRPDLATTLADTFDRADPGLASQDSVVNEKTAPGASPAAKRIEARYTRAYQLHASIGPSCAVAQAADGKLTVWTHSQGVFPLRGDMARALGVAPESIACIHAEGSGCYGQNGADDVAFDAALVARALPGRPVRLQWMREDEFMWEPFGSAMIMKMRAGLDASGRIVDWQHELWSYPHTTRPGGREGVNLLAAWYVANPSPPTFPADVPLPSGGADRNAIPLYDFPTQRIVKHYLPEQPLRTSALRTLGAYANVFALESFMDETAGAAGADPVEFRLRHLTDPRARAVIEAAARKAGWQPGAKLAASGNTLRGRGIGFARYKNLGCYCAVVAEVEVDRASGVVRVTRAVSAVDAGLAVNPDGVVNQIEGGIIQSASWTLKEALRFDRAGVKTRGWADYPILRFSEVPAVEVEVIQLPAERSLGVGEGSQGPAAGAIANAFAAATGRRLRDIPFTPERVKAALA
jgi:CO/xanthine dehydrogenase Mo-binding subunit